MLFREAYIVRMSEYVGSSSTFPSLSSPDLSYPYLSLPYLTYPYLSCVNQKGWKSLISIEIIIAGVYLGWCWVLFKLYLKEDLAVGGRWQARARGTARHKQKRRYADTAIRLKQSAAKLQQKLFHLSTFLGLWAFQKALDIFLFFPLYFFNYLW